MMFVIKRNGREDAFDKNKISNAIKKAFIEVDGDVTEDANKIASKISNEIANIKKEKMSVEDIQDMVVNKLMATSRKDVASHYARTTGRECLMLWLYSCMVICTNAQWNTVYGGETASGSGLRRNLPMWGN